MYSSIFVVILFSRKQKKEKRVYVVVDVEQVLENLINAFVVAVIAIV